MCVYVCVCMRTQVHMCLHVGMWGAAVHVYTMASVWMSENNFQKEVLFFYYVGPGIKLRLGGKHLYPSQPSQQHLLQDLNVLVFLYLKTLCYSRILAIHSHQLLIITNNPSQEARMIWLIGVLSTRENLESLRRWACWQISG